MAGEGRSPSTRNARTSGQADSGTGQHSTTAPGGVAKLSRTNDSPSKSSGTARMSTERRDESSQRSTTPPGGNEPARMLRDSGAKTERERTFTRINAEIRSKLDGTNDRSFFPSGYEKGTLNEISRGDGYAGTKPTIRKNRAQ